MTNPALGGSRTLIVLAAILTLGACTLPRSGPTFSEILPESDAAQEELGYDVLTITQDVSAVTRIDESRGFSVDFADGRLEATSLISRGDVMAITVWENIDEGLLNPQGVGATPLPQSVVDERGFLFVPYVGLVRAAGRSLGQVREEIRASLAEKTLNPQVDVFPVETVGRSYSAQGLVGQPGIYPLTAQNRRLLGALAQAGGIATDQPETVRVTIRRGPLEGEIWLSDLYNDPRNDIPVRAGDAIIAEADERSYTALGAINRPTRVTFDSREISLLEAVATVAGLNDQIADPRGVFVFRREAPEVYNRLVSGGSATTAQPVVYVMDLTSGESVFAGQTFMVRDKDTVYVTEAPFTAFQKVLQAISPVLGFTSSVRNLSGQ